MSPTRVEGTESAAGFPRVSGDEPLDGKAGDKIILFSPRERG